MHGVSRWRTGCLPALITLFVVGSPWSGGAYGQIPVTPVASVPQGPPIWDCGWIVPQARRSVFGSDIRVEGVDASVSIRGQVATTTLEIAIRNPTGTAREAQLLVPVPAGAVVKAFAFQGTRPDSQAQVLELHSARAIYDDIVRRAKDPALLEFVGMSSIRSSVFPVVANGTQKLRVVYESLLQRDGDRVDYLLPRSESVAYSIPWNVNVAIEHPAGIATVYSPSHFVETVQPSGSRATVRLSDRSRRTPGPFRLSYLERSGPVTASVYTYPDADGKGGYFLMLGGVPEPKELVAKAAETRREITLVIDRSGSMQGGKLDQAKEAARQIIAGMSAHESFNLIIYNDQVERFSEHSLPITSDSLAAVGDYLDQVRPQGGTNLYGALSTALATEPAEGSVPLVLFLTDGLPTVGERRESEIRKLAVSGNPFSKRVFTFGVGYDVNTPLLDRIARESRAIATYVQPTESVELKVSSVFKRLIGLVFVEPMLRAVDEQGAEQAGRLIDVLPGRLPDLFSDDQLVVLGRYVGTKPLKLRLQGKFLGETRAFEFPMGVEHASVKNAFVPRLWASRKIGDLTDAIRDLELTGIANARGRNPFGVASTSGGAGVTNANPRLNELVAEVVALSLEHGILTEYTAFFANEGIDLAATESNLAVANSNYFDRAIKVRSGKSSFNQEVNRGYWRSQSCANPTNEFVDAQMNPVTIGTVQQVNDRAFFYRGNRWVDSRVGDKEREEPNRIVIVGTEAYQNLIETLAGQGRVGCLSLQGEILLKLGGERILILKEPIPAGIELEPVVPEGSKSSKLPGDGC